MIKGKRSLLANLLFQSKAYRGLKSFDSRTLVIFNFHRIRRDSSTPAVFDDGVFGPTQGQLHDQLRWLKENTGIISEAQLLDHAQGRIRLNRSSVMITFDDGYRDNAELALPVLRELKIPALFFISTQAIQTREVGWWDQIAYLVKNTRKPKIRLGNEDFDLSKTKTRAIREIQRWMRVRKAEETRDLVQNLAHACDVPIPGPELSSRELMTWRQIEEARTAGITIGSHTHSHRVLSTLSLTEQYEEFRLSKEILENRLQTRIRSIAYPVGGETDCHRETAGLARKCGYELGFSFQTGANWLDRLDPFRIGRVSAEDSVPLTCAAITLPSIFARSRYRKASAHSFSLYTTHPISSNPKEGTT